jgi:SSS family solute:Na+ symporter
MGLRGAVVFTPLLRALWLPGRIHRRWCILSAIAGPVIVLIFGVWKVLPIDSLFLGIAASMVIMGVGWAMGRTEIER